MVEAVVEEKKKVNIELPGNVRVSIGELLQTIDPKQIKKPQLREAIEPKPIGSNYDEVSLYNKTCDYCGPGCSN